MTEIPYDVFIPSDVYVNTKRFRKNVSRLVENLSLQVYRDVLKTRETADDDLEDFADDTASRVEAGINRIIKEAIFNEYIGEENE